MRTMKLILLPVVVFVFATAVFADDPFPMAIGDWQRAGEITSYEGDDLFEYINGGAELYHEYDFTDVVITDYLRGDDMITTEIYTFSMPAYGIFTILGGGDGRYVEIGNGAMVSEYYLLFWSGNSLVAVTSGSEFDEMEEQLIAVARGVAANLEKTDALPGMLSMLPTDDRQELSERYFVGTLALQNISETAFYLLSGFEEGVAASYSDDGILFVLRYTDNPAALKAIADSRTRSSQVSSISLEVSANGFAGNKGGSTFFRATVQGNYILFVTGLTAGECKKLETAYITFHGAN